MKRIFSMLLCLCLLAAGAALSESWGVGDGIDLTLDGQPVRLSFDRSEAYSSVMNGNVQASFFAYANGDKTIYELYMVFPESVRGGDSVTPESAIQGAHESSVVLIITDNQDEAYYFAGQIDTGAYPEGSSYNIHFDTVADAADGTRYEGRLTATLVGMEMSSGTILGNIQITDAPFSFTMPAANRRSVIDAPESTPDQEPNPFETSPETTPSPLPETTPQQTFRV